MRHIDDGALHAYLDGAHDLIGAPGGVDALVAHLAECASCRARLEAERATRDRADAILAMGAPRATDLPPFAALEGRRGTSDAGAGAAVAREGDGGAAGRPALRRYARRRVPLAWAATVVLALGAGWIAREVLETPRGERLSAVTAGEPETESRSERVESAGEDVGVPEALPAADEPRSGPVAPAAVAGQSPAGRSGRVAADPVSGAETDAGRIALVQADERPEADALAAPPPPVQFAPETPAVDSARQPRTDALLAEATAEERARERREPRVLIGEPVDDARYRQAAAATPAAPPPPPPPVLEDRPTAIHGLVVTGAAGDSEARWRPVDRRAAEAALGRPILVVPGLPVIAIEEPEAGPRTTLRVRQRVETGEVLTLEHSLVEPVVARAGEAAAAAAPVRTAESEQLVVRAGARPVPVEVEARVGPYGSSVEMRDGDLVVHAWAPIPLDRLRELLARLR